MSVACQGFSNLDHAVTVNRPIEPGVTSLVEARHSGPHGRLGGCAANIAVGLARAGVSTRAISWVGQDPEADAVLGQLGDAGVDARGVLRDPARRTGLSWLASAVTGESYCVFDPGGAAPDGLTGVQREALAGVEALVVAVGPPGPAAQALTELASDVLLLWTVKADPASFPPALVSRLAARADVIVHNEPESAFLTEALGADWSPARARCLRVETRGAQGARWSSGSDGGACAPERPLDVRDAAGAGDRFCAGLLAALLGGHDPDTSVRAGMRGAEALLHERRGREPAIH